MPRQPQKLRSRPLLDGGSEYATPSQYKKHDLGTIGSPAQIYGESVGAAFNKVAQEVYSHISNAPIVKGRYEVTNSTFTNDSVYYTISPPAKPRERYLNNGTPHNPDKTGVLSDTILNSVASMIPRYVKVKTYPGRMDGSIVVQISLDKSYVGTIDYATKSLVPWISSLIVALMVFCVFYWVLATQGPPV